MVQNKFGLQALVNLGNSAQSTSHIATGLRDEIPNPKGLNITKFHFRATSVLTAQRAERATSNRLYATWEERDFLWLLLTCFNTVLKDNLRK